MLLVNTVFFFVALASWLNARHTEKETHAVRLYNLLQF